ncbi:MAG: phosphoribosylaminoimidazolesuccinocarboxamide synthase, partial [bacterium]
ICGLKLPQGLTESEKLPEVMFTPSSKAAPGEHDQNISYKDTINLIGTELAFQVQEASLKLYTWAAEYALERGIILADTKFEFGRLDGRLILIDEVLTPDSSRFWPVEGYRPGRPQPSFDKQFVRDYLKESGWDISSPPPELPDEIVSKTVSKYQEALNRLIP